MERDKGEYLDMDDEKREQLDEQSQVYVQDVAAEPMMNGGPAAKRTDPASDDPEDSPEPAEM